MAKVEELSLLLIRMALQNADFIGQSESMLVFTAIYTAATLLQMDSAKSSSEVPSSPKPSNAIFFAQFKNHLWKTFAALERGIANSPLHAND